jgi:hypothetical protein
MTPASPLRFGRGLSALVLLAYPVVLPIVFLVVGVCAGGIAVRSMLEDVPETIRHILGHGR